MQTVTVPFVLDQMTHSNAVVGLGAFFTFFPIVVAAPLAGTLADRYSRRGILLWSQAVMMVAAFGLFVLWVSGAATPVNLLVCVTVSGTANGITIAAWQSFVTQLVPREEMLNAVRLNSMQFTASRAFGPALAGLVLASAGPGAAFFANGVSFVVVLVALGLIPPREIGARTRSRMVTEFLEGIRYVRERRLFSTAVLITFVFSFFGQPIIQLVEPFSRHVLDVGAGKYGVLVAVLGAGSILGSLTTVYGARLLRSRLIAVGFVGFIAAELALALAPSYAFALVAAMLLGAATPIWQVSIFTAVQDNVDEVYRGRVVSLSLIAFFAAGPIGAVAAGVISESIGLRSTFVLAATALAVFAIGANARLDRFRLFDQTVAVTRAPKLAGEPA